MSPTAPALTVILPAFNEEGSIEQAVRRASEAVAPLVSSYEIVVVDNGSRDETPKILHELEREMGAALVVVTQPTNLGYGGALRTGFDTARGRLVFYTDADTAHPSRGPWQLDEEQARGSAPG